jgi:hypothetical protein
VLLIPWLTAARMSNLPVYLILRRCDGERSDFRSQFEIPSVHRNTSMHSKSRCSVKCELQLASRSIHMKRPTHPNGVEPLTTED